MTLKDHIVRDRSFGDGSQLIEAAALADCVPGADSLELRHDVHQLLDRSLVFQPSGQLVLLCVAAVALVAAVLRRSTYDLGGAA